MMKGVLFAIQCYLVVLLGIAPAFYYQVLFTSRNTDRIRGRVALKGQVVIVVLAMLMVEVLCLHTCPRSCKIRHNKGNGQRWTGQYIHRYNGVCVDMMANYYKAKTLCLHCFS